MTRVVSNNASCPFHYFFSYAVQKLEEAFTIDVYLSICIPMSKSETFCVPTDGVMHLLKDERIPACLHKLNFFEGTFCLCY